ncbi:phosphatase PAP2 family protein [Halocynthiibacter sp. C4]|uniref:phosphatase PAP2 family protein n=1 Tax=Halocynthiibacter sp. C4 TaxID=2992758 RepID=UPI00237B6A8F|nr:phosphatase PAP2 family protein [Halocynthiibacter sp. C4]MDE0590256.1 phosphatase PAP2 family protein [Halocynthiibacter sp. C4]
MNTFAKFALELAPWWVYAILLLTLAVIGSSRKLTVHNLANAFFAIFLCAALTFMFSMIKVQFPKLMPFWADPMLTQIDQFLHFGNNPRALLAPLASISPDTLEIIYHSGWVFLATFFPVLLMAFDPCETRTKQFILLWASCWIVLGNLLAVAFMSAGPIFAGLVAGVDPDIHSAAITYVDQENASFLRHLREELWLVYTKQTEFVGAGISAFPSVHVGMASVLGLYMIRVGRDVGQNTNKRSTQAVWKWAGRIAGLSTILLFLVLSVYLTWHYAVDGYAALIIIIALYALIRRSSLFSKKAQIHPSSGLNMPKA